MVVNVKGDAPSLSLFTRPYLHNSLYNNQLQRSGLDCTSSLGNNDYYFRPGKLEETSFPLNLPWGMGTY
jgi:hypothetical protein